MIAPRFGLLYFLNEDEEKYDSLLFRSDAL